MSNKVRKERRLRVGKKFLKLGVAYLKEKAIIVF